MNRGSGFALALLGCCVIAGLLAVGSIAAAGGFAQEDIDMRSVEGLNE